MDYLFFYLILINAAGFVFMLTDKYKAQHKMRRTPESALMFVAVIGGSLGSLLGMYAVRHKTKHKKFSIGIPILLVLQCLLLYYIAPYL